MLIFKIIPLQNLLRHINPVWLLLILESFDYKKLFQRKFTAKNFSYGGCFTLRAAESLR